MFAMRAFQDEMSVQNCGIPPGVYPVGATSGNAMQYSEYRKLNFLVQLGSVGSVNAQFAVAIQVASASAGTFTTVFGTGFSAGSAGGVTGSLALLNGSVFSNQAFFLDTRGEAVYSAISAQSMSVAPWIRAVLSTSNSSVTCGVLALGYNHEYAPGYNYASSTAYASAQSVLWY